MNILAAFLSGLLAPQRNSERLNGVRHPQSEEQIDKTLMDSFPASDPPAWY